MGLHGVEVDEGPDDDMYMPDGMSQRDNAVRLKEKNSVGDSVTDPGWLYRIPDPDFYPFRIPDLGSKNSNKREGPKKICG